MSSINVEVLKQLLDEFDSKQAECTEEISLVEQQILELQHRIVACREKMSIVADDRAKVMDMMHRYGALAAQPRMTLVKPTPVVQQEVVQQQVVQQQVSMVANGRPEVAPQVAAPQIQTQPQAQGSMAAKAAAAMRAAAQQQQAPAAPVEEDETVKNINEALRGLFR